MVQDALDRVRGLQTTLVVAHRLSTLKSASLIAVVQSGTILETGIHEELSRNHDSTYIQLIRFQEKFEPEKADKLTHEDYLENDTDERRVSSGRSEHQKDETCFTEPTRDYSSRCPSPVRTYSRRVSRSKLSFGSDNFSLSNHSSKHFDAAQDHHLLDDASKLGKEEKAQDTAIVIRQRVSLMRFAGVNKPEFLFLFFGAVGSAAIGMVLPFFAFALAKSITALQQSTPQSIRHDATLYASGLRHSWRCASDLRALFSYSTQPTLQVLQGVSFLVQPGKKLALVGGSGSGKSALISLIERFYDRTSGSILIDRMEIQILTMTWLRCNIGLVSQEPVLFDDTIRDNILYGKGSDTTEDELHQRPLVYLRITIWL
ncbi:hypothetical protein R1sor_005692 [Riccia sorocarpa]|uniref:ABC transporter domain-containing protein n=1 Tax=Riccia sorocarpa TaxID=122646 RepID=A0ABD3HM82_9MARC